MTQIAYEEWRPGQEALSVIVQAEVICADYQRQGYDLTLRQLYYQFVARDLIPNTDRSYKRLGSIINRARMAGLLDWNYIVDRTRSIAGVGYYTTPDQMIQAVAAGFTVDHWVDQATHVEVWVEKEALAGVVARAAQRYDAPYFSCRGYVSQSELWRAGQRLGKAINKGKDVLVLHLGDHDPSGIDMTRDIFERLTVFIDEFSYADQLEVRRIALNRDQIDEYDPPPNPAKLTDSRVGPYLALHGNESWELDALEPSVLDDLISEHIGGVVDMDLWEVHDREEERERARLQYVADRWEEIAAEYDAQEGT